MSKIFRFLNRYGFAFIAIVSLLLAVLLNFVTADLCEKYCCDVHGVRAAYRIGMCECVFYNDNLPINVLPGGGLPNVTGRCS